MSEVPTHAVSITLSEPTPQEVAVGADILAKVTLTCHAGCDLRSVPLMVAAADGTAACAPAPGHGDVRDVKLKAPNIAGVQVWQLSFPSDGLAGIRHIGETLSVSVMVRPHTTSLAVWDIPSPAVIGKQFEIKAGAKSSDNCGLAGQGIEVRDGNGATLARATLGDRAWPGTTGLYWTAVALAAPPNEGQWTWSVRFAATELDLPHEGCSAIFNVRTVRPPEHRLTVRVVASETAEPIDEAHIRVGAYRATTDPAGRAEIGLPKGRYELFVWKAGFEAPEQTVQVDADMSVEVAAIALPEEDPDAIWA